MRLNAQATWLSIQELSVRLGPSRTSLVKYLLMTGAPRPNQKGRYHVEKVRAWLVKHGGMNVAGSAIAQLRESKLKIEAEEMKFDYDVKRGDYIHKRNMVPAVAAAMSQLTSTMLQKFVMELPQQYKGKNIHECAELNRKAVTYVLTLLKEGSWAVGLDDPMVLKGSNAS